MMIEKTIVFGADVGFKPLNPFRACSFNMAIWMSAFQSNWQTIQIGFLNVNQIKFRNIDKKIIWRRFIREFTKLNLYQHFFEWSVEMSINNLVHYDHWAIFSRILRNILLCTIWIKCGIIQFIELFNLI